jgi:hypothetical protein
LGRVEASNDLTLVENADVLASHPCCRLLNGSDRYWTHRGYLAENRARTRFRREASRRAVAEDGTVTSFTRTRVELAFSAPPVTLGGRSDCRFEVAIRVETTGFEARDFGPLALPCLVEDDDQGLSTLVVPGWDQRDGRSLRETPYQARGLWAEMLEAESDVADWPEEPRAVLTAAFEPYLAFEKTRPDVLFHYLDANAPTIAGYAWTDE